MSKSLGQGTLIEVDLTGSGPWTAIGHILNYRSPSSARPDVDVTTIDSTAREYLKGLADGGTISLPVIYDASDAGQVGLEGARTGNTPLDFRMTLANTEGTIVTFSALVNDFTVEGGVDAANQGTIELRVTGAVTWDHDPV